MFEVFIDQLLSYGYTFEVGGGIRPNDAHYVITVKDNVGNELSRATGYNLQEVFIEAFGNTPPKQVTE
jgi:hypothetical protein